MGAALVASAWLFTAGMVPLARAQGDDCRNAEFRIGPSKHLPECRAYEMVSPPNKEGGEARPILTFVTRYQASASGDSVMYPSSIGFGETESLSVGAFYKARRKATGWKSDSAMPPVAPFAAFTALYSPLVASDDLSRVVQITNVDAAGNPLVDPGGQPSPAISLLLEDLATGSREMLLRDETPGVSAPTVVGDEDFNPVFLQVPEQLTNDAPVSGLKIYRHQDGVTTLASILPDGTPSTGSIGGNNSDGLRRVSDDGEVLYFNVGSGQSAALFRREDGETTRIDDSENPGVSPSDAVFRTSSADGSRAFFTTGANLVPEDTHSFADLYLYEHSPDPDNDENLTLISQNAHTSGQPAQVQGILGASDDGTRVYFVTNNQLLPGEPTTPERKLFVWEDGPGGGTLDFIGGLSAGDGDLWLNRPTPFDPRPSQVSPDGRYLIVVTSTPLTVDDNGGVGQVYVYDRLLDRWSCVSCRTDSQPPTFPAHLREFVPGSFMDRLNSQPTRNVSSHGHVFFETAEPLVPRDTNGQTDVYVWKDGEPDLISSGRSGEDSHFADASEDGSRVFFVARDRLTTLDVDSHLDLYVARINGGFPAPPVPKPPCRGDACQGVPPQPPIATEIGSQELTGSGNARDRADCRRLGRKATIVQRKAKRTGRRVRQADTPRQAKKLRRVAKRQRHRARRLKARLKRCQRANYKWSARDQGGRG